MEGCQRPKQAALEKPSDNPLKVPATSSPRTTHSTTVGSSRSDVNTEIFHESESKFPPSRDGSSGPRPRFVSRFCAFRYHSYSAPVPSALSLLFEPRLSILPSPLPPSRYQDLWDHLLRLPLLYLPFLPSTELPSGHRGCNRPCFSQKVSNLVACYKMLHA